MRDDEIPNDIQGAARRRILSLDPVIRKAAVQIERNLRDRGRVRLGVEENGEDDEQG